MTDELLLTDEQIEDANFAAKDGAWVALTKMFDVRAEQGMTYASLGRRIRRSRAQVQRWFESPFNLSLRSLGLLAEGMDSELVIDIRPRVDAVSARSNYCHPSEDVGAAVSIRDAGQARSSKSIERLTPTVALGGIKAPFKILETTE